MMAVSSFERSLTEEKLHDAEQRLAKSLQQIVVIDSQIRELEILYKRAQKSKKNASRYNLRLKLSVVSGEYDLVTYLQSRCQNSTLKLKIIRLSQELACNFQNVSEFKG